MTPIEFLELYLFIGAVFVTSFFALGYVPIGDLKTKATIVALWVIGWPIGVAIYVVMSLGGEPHDDEPPRPAA